ncbi:MAG TPA: hypothetical protein VD907_01810 [Verrucomicrobiae bacterium]|nr:hypothetical protein [Verrucomicrobiae bacterium]
MTKRNNDQQNQSREISKEALHAFAGDERRNVATQLWNKLCREAETWNPALDDIRNLCEELAKRHLHGFGQKNQALLNDWARYLSGPAMAEQKKR